MEFPDPIPANMEPYIPLINACRSFALQRKGPKRMCYIVSNHLQSRLKYFGLETELVNGEVLQEDGTWIHWWLKLSDGRIIDATASQFKHEGVKGPKVYIGTLPAHYKEVNRKIMSWDDFFNEDIEHNKKEINSIILKFPECFSLKKKAMTQKNNHSSSI